MFFSVGALVSPLCRNAPGPMIPLPAFPGVTWPGEPSRFDPHRIDTSDLTCPTPGCPRLICTDEFCPTVRRLADELVVADLVAGEQVREARQRRHA